MKEIRVIDSRIPPARSSTLLAIAFVMTSFFCRTEQQLSNGKNAILPSEAVHAYTARKNLESQNRERNLSTCDLYSGSWVKDENQPFYDGRKCKWISAHWVCRNGKNSTFEFEKYRWQPSSCDPPRLNAVELLSRFRDKTVAFVGDSLGRQQFQSFLCMADFASSSIDTEESKAIDVGKSEFGFFKPKGKRGPIGQAVRFLPSNLTVVFFGSEIICASQNLRSDGKFKDMEETVEFNRVWGKRNQAKTGQGRKLLQKPAENNFFRAQNGNLSASYNEGRMRSLLQEEMKRAVHVDRANEWIELLVEKSDYLVLNSGHHWNRNKKQVNRWEFIFNQKPFPGGIAAARAVCLRSALTAMHKLAANKLQKTGQKTLLFLRTLSPRHFTNGDWNTGGTCDAAVMSWKPPGKGKESGSGFRAIVKGLNVTLLNVTYLSNFREEAHLGSWDLFKRRKSSDCLHWCLPGVPDTWNQLLFWESLRS